MAKVHVAAIGVGTVITVAAAALLPYPRRKDMGTKQGPFDPNVLPDNPALPNDPSQKAFILKIAPLTRKVQVLTGIPASVGIAQAIKESGWGERPIPGDRFGPSYNYLGHKCSSRDRETPLYVEWRPIQLVWTSEEISGQIVRVQACFKGYWSELDGFLDWAFRFYRFAYYFGDNTIKRALSYRRNWQAFLDNGALYNYATGNKYVLSVKEIIKNYQLYRYDVPVEHWRLHPVINQLLPAAK
jgi:flagellum-specific peptidoglycan hydrolase FlgJ